MDELENLILAIEKKQTRLAKIWSANITHKINAQQNELIKKKKIEC